MHYKSIVIVPLIIISQFIPGGFCWLFFPRHTVLQVTMCMVIPYQHPVRKLNMNVGLQVNFALPWNVSEFRNPPNWDQERDLASKRDHAENSANDKRLKRDLGAGEFYTTLEELIQLRGYHSTCIMKAVCELAQHSFHHDEENLLNSLLHFAFTPSLHDSFEEDELHHQLRYKRAEKLGRRGACQQAFRLCHKSPLEEFTYLDTDLH